MKCPKCAKPMGEGETHCWRCGFDSLSEELANPPASAQAAIRCGEGDEAQPPPVEPVTTMLMPEEGLGGYGGHGIISVEGALRSLKRLLKVATFDLSVFDELSIGSAIADLLVPYAAFCVAINAYYMISGENPLTTAFSAFVQLLVLPLAFAFVCSMHGIETHLSAWFLGGRGRLGKMVASYAYVYAVGAVLCLIAASVLGVQGELTSRTASRGLFAWIILVGGSLAMTLAVILAASRTYHMGAFTALLAVVMLPFLLSLGLVFVLLAFLMVARF
jgi:hypothetical protein